jgi:ribosomal protein S17
MTDNVRYIRDYKRREEREAEIKRFANRLVELGDQIRAMQDTPASRPTDYALSEYSAPEEDAG